MNLDKKFIADKIKNISMKDVECEMNKLIKTNENYRKNSAILPEFLINTTVILDDIASKCFIWHLPGRSAELRSKRFKETLFGNN